MLSSGLMTRLAKAVDSDGSRSNDLCLCRVGVGVLDWVQIGVNRQTGEKIRGLEFR
jgi:hypothetical protein